MGGWGGETEWRSGWLVSGEGMKERVVLVVLLFVDARASRARVLGALGYAGLGAHFSGAGGGDGEGGGGGERGGAIENGEERSRTGETGQRETETGQRATRILAQTGIRIAAAAATTFSFMVLPSKQRIPCQNNYNHGE